MNDNNCTRDRTIKRGQVRKVQISVKLIQYHKQHIPFIKLDGCIVWNAHNTVLGEEALVIYVVPVCYIKTGTYGKT